MARFHCDVLTADGDRVCAGIISVRQRRGRDGVRSWDGHFVSFDDSTAPFRLDEQEYTFRLRDGSEHCAILNRITLGTAGPYVGFVGARGSGPGALPE